MKVTNWGYENPRTVKFGDKEFTFQCSQRYMGQYPVPCKDGESSNIDLTNFPFSPDNNEKTYFLQYVEVIDRKFFDERCYKYELTEEVPYLGVLVIISDDGEDFGEMLEQFELASNKQLGVDYVECYCDIMLYDKFGNVLKYKEVND